VTVPRTSHTDPLQVDFVPLSAWSVPGRLGMTIAPGKCGQGMLIFWARDLEADLNRLRHYYQADWLVTLIEEHEFDLLYIPDLLERAQDAGLKTRWFPIPDFSVPKSPLGLVSLVQDLLVALRAGETVVVHCRGGLGRTGLVVACCLVALGSDPKTAIAEVRQAREHTIETPAQEDYLYEFQATWKEINS